MTINYKIIFKYQYTKYIQREFGGKQTERMVGDKKMIIFVTLFILMTFTNADDGMRGEGRWLFREILGRKSYK